MAEASFDEVAQIYDETIPPHVRDHYLEKRLNFIKGLIKGGLLLDAGCGTGVLDYHLKISGLDVVGVDISREMLKKANKRGLLNCLCASAAKLPFKPESFDMVISIVCLHHLCDGKIIFDALSEMVRVTKRNGLILVWDHNPLNPYWKLFMKRLPQDKDVNRTIPLEEIVNDFRQLGIRDMIIQRLGFIPDFIPAFLLGPFKMMEKLVENIPLIKEFCAHNVIVARRG